MDNVDIDVEESAKIREYIKKVAVVGDGKYNETVSGVPRIIFNLENNVLGSAVYMSQKAMWKMFWPFPSDRQRKKYFASHDEMLAYIEGRRKNAFAEPQHNLPEVAGAIR